MVHRDRERVCHVTDQGRDAASLYCHWMCSYVAAPSSVQCCLCVYVCSVGVVLVEVWTIGVHSCWPLEPTELTSFRFRRHP